ncbi:MAG TPA: TonB-dependent receptor plug domain-containing protein [Opitutus sp.]|nr:TonB-dependent receptor plug domain-containing protein [Opitutus sp.]
MKSDRRRFPIPRPLSLWIALAALVTPALAQTAPSSAGAAPDERRGQPLNERELAQLRAEQRATGALEQEEAVLLSPFEVVENNRGYLASNTMSGTRVNSRLEDLGSSISVVTKDQMMDFAMLDINDIFAYEASTEGAGNFTDFAFNQSSQPQDNLQSNPNTANRVRGLTSANIAYGGFETSRRVPLDPISMESVEISRGPNSNLFGLGNASGTANSVPASANLSRNRAQIQLRADSFGDPDYDMSMRESVDVNRVLIKDKLALRVSQVYQDTEFTRQPAGVEVERYNFMVKYRPFKKTTISGTFQYFKQEGVRPNSITPRDAVTPWIENGAPTWDPLTNTAYINGSPVNKAGLPTTALGSGIPTIAGAAVFNSGFQTTGRGTSLLFIEPTGVAYWTAPRGTTSDDALLKTTAANNQANRNYVLLSPQTLRRTQPLWSSDAAVSNKDMYDYSSINAASMNYFEEVMKTSFVTIDQIFLDSSRQTLAGELGWFREDSPRYYHDFPTGSAGSTYLFVDPNMRRLDGTDNPYFMRPYFGMSETNVIDRPLLNDTVRGQLAYKLDLSREKSWLRWLGMHQMSGYGEYKKNQMRSYFYQLAMLDDHSWLPAGTPRANGVALAGDPLPQNQASPTGSRSYRFYFVGDNNGHDIDYAPFSGSLDGVYDYTWGNFAAGQSVNEPTQLGLAASRSGTGGAQNSLKVQRTQGAVLQSHLLGGRLVTTFGLRRDEVETKAGVEARLMPDGKSHDFAWARQWEPGPYQRNTGDTKTMGAVLKLTSWLSVHGNKSDSFIPADSAIDLHGRFLPNPQGKGKDYGLSLQLFDGKLHIRANEFEVLTENDRSGNSSTLATRAVKMDVFDGQPSRLFSLDGRARQWLQATQGLSGSALDAAVAQEMKMDPAILSMLQTSVNFGGLPIAAAQNAESKGRELEIHYNPTNYWTVKANVTESETIQAAIAQDLLDYLDERMPVWTSIVDKETGNPWFTSSYDGGQTPQDYMPRQVTTALGIAQQTVGKSLPQIRKYRANLSTNFHLRGITDHRILKKFNVGGAVRWEDRGSIGYYGVQQLPAIITQLDRDRPIWDGSHTYFDFLAGYRTKLNDKVSMVLQLNVRNVQESGRLQPVSAFPDGTPNAYRIVDPRQFILTSTFNF